MITSVSGQMLTSIKCQMIPAPGGLVMARRLLTRKNRLLRPRSLLACRRAACEAHRERRFRERLGCRDSNPD